MLKGTMRKIWTISLPPDLEKEVLRVMREEKRTRSEFVREALREYLETNEIRKLVKQKAKERFFNLVDRIRERTKDVPEEEIKRLVDEAIEAVRSRRRSS